ncbi:FAD/NAD(P)-binding protein [uncultured Roseobacter sp.]|uniref:FAD/NAD(P)-binding protein n=1 Tax=uncultured Roseobacter sp. TaxID=114847 RepID=UPI00262BDF29|nr:FAD/NAD(P)-binding protein [uncultured Roseobacter sp.]
MPTARTTPHRAPGGQPHVIVGDGITALAFLETCLSRDMDHIVVLGRTASQLGRGAAYAKGVPGTAWRYAYLLNSPADDIDPKFAAWLAEHWPDVTAKMQGRSPDWLGAAAPLVDQGDLFGVNAPREFYGDFMEAQAQAIIAQLKARGCVVTCRDETVVVMEPAEDAITLTTDSGQRLAAASVDVAPGGPATLRIDGDERPFSAPSVFGHEARIAEHIRAGAEIFCIGGNAAMLDVLRLCQSLVPERALRFVACAPDGEVPAPLIPRLPRKLTVPQLSAGHPTARSFLDKVRREIDRAHAAGDEMREIRAGFRAHFLHTPLSHYVPDRGEARQVPLTLRLWLRGGTRDTILDLHRLIREGRARLVHGFVEQVMAQADGAEVLVRDPSGRVSGHRTGFVVNCAGAGPTSAYDPLTEDMLAQGLLSRAATGGLKVGPGCRAGAAAVRYLSPAVSEIGDEVIAMPLYDAHMLRSYVARSG